MWQRAEKLQKVFDETKIRATYNIATATNEWIKATWRI